MNKLVVFDIGGGGGIHRSWNRFPTNLAYYSFDPNPDQANELIEQSKDVSEKSKNTYRVINKAVTGKTELRRINIFDNRFAGSLYQHTIGGCYRFERMKLLSQLEIDCVSVGDFCKEEQTYPDFLTIDAEGSTFDVLRGATTEIITQRVLGIRLELELSHMYEHSPKFYESIRLLDDSGYKLARMETCNSGFFGATTDMNRYSVSPSDAMPLTTDAIFVNTTLIRSLIDDELTESSLFKITNSIVFCIHNGCGYYGMDLLVQFKKRHPIEALVGTEGFEKCLIALFKEIAMYFSFERKNINKDFDAAEEFYQFTGRTLNQFDNHDTEVFQKLRDLYDEDNLYQKWVNPRGQIDTANFS